jgi:hypothetical protein
MLGMGFWFTVSTYRTINSLQMARLRCTAAAQAQLDSWTATGEMLDDQFVETHWPGVTLTTTRTPGKKAWAGLIRTSVCARTDIKGRMITLKFTRYLPAPIGGAP